MSPGVIALIVAAAGVVAVVVNASRHNVPVSRFVPYLVLAFVGGFITTAVAYLFVPVVWLLLAVAPGAAAWWLSEHVGARNYHRRSLRLLLAARLNEVIPGWEGRSLLIQWDGGHLPADVVEIKIGLPAKTSPAKVVPNIKAVINETVGGQWSIATKGTVLTCRRAVVVNDPPPLKHLKDVLSDRDCFGDGYRLKKCDLTADNTAVESYVVGYSNGNAFAKTAQKRSGVETVLRERVPVPSGSWMFDWKLADAELEAVRSAFEPIMYAKPIKHFVQSREEAIDLYPKAEFVLGVYGDGSPVIWSPVAEGTPHCNTCGASGKGKTSWAHTLIAQAAALGWCVIIADFKLAKSFRGFLDWPNVHVVTNGVYSNIKTIYYVVEILNRRRAQSGASSVISDDVPILFIMDEYADFAMQMVKNVWPRFKGQGDPSQPPVLGEMDQLIIMCREFRIHIVTMLQKPSADFINTNIIFNSGKKFQVGNMEGPMSNTYWGNYDIGSSFPDVPGRGLVKDADSRLKAREFQAYYTPDPIKARKPKDLAILAELLPQKSLYPRVTFDLPSPYDITQWDQIVTAPWELADERPDLDPLSPYFRPQPIFTYDTLGDMDPASMSVQR
ncbi:cell divisionFtsK/SpoIIIE [Mycolicibacterium novocastrense]|uniref:Cell divisionFtsK/SpoIIIE n=1 Tax=Mycolicibacterium novocastrense TaxID=59813 RepID=A0ABQ0KE13_MYCNV|nr:cell divisionFtsK/SpoIIIE [Mycolicibacterium novocastrense]